MLLMISCSGKVSYKPLKEIPAKPVCTVEFPTDDSLRLTFNFSQSHKAGNKKKSFLEQISEVNSVIYANDSRLDSISTNEMKINSVPYGKNSISTDLSVVLPWRKPGYVNSNLLNFNLEIVTPKVIYTGLVNLREIASNNGSKAPQRAVTVIPSYAVANDSTLDFTLSSKRNFIEEKEYIPNSETIRLEIFDSNGGRVYSSNHGMNYFQVIKHVLPDEIGRTYNYHVFWNRRNDAGELMEHGKYTAKLTIPARPLPYAASLDFEF